MQSVRRIGGTHPIPVAGKMTGDRAEASEIAAG